MKLICSILCCLALAGIVSGADVTVNETDEVPTYIFFQEGDGGSFVKDESGNYTLTITGVMPYTIYFSDRPARDAGFMNMDDFLKGFSFAAYNPPNALLEIREGEENSDVIVVELTSPQYDGTNSTLTYTAKVLADYVFESEWLKDLTPKVDKAIPESFGRVAIVIDNEKLSCGDSSVACEKNDGSICGYISTGCCWNWRHVHCEPCSNNEKYDQKCKEKYGSNCGYYGHNSCFD